MGKIVQIVMNNGPTNMGFNDFYKNIKDSDVIAFERVNQKKKSKFNNVINFVKVIYQIRSSYEVYHIHSHALCFITCFIYLIFKPVNLKKCLYTVHTSRNNLNIKNFIFYITGILLAHRIVFCGKSSYDSFTDFISKATRQRQKYIPNGVKVYPSSVANKQYNEYAYVGRLMELKKVDFLIRNFHKYNISKTLNVIGDGPQKNDLFEKYNSQYIVFHGLKPRQFVFDQLLTACVFISASSKEGLPVAALEAASFGSFLLLSDIPAHREIHEKIPHSLIFKDEYEFMTHLQYLENKNPIFFQKVFYENSTATFDHFSVEAMLEKYADLYHEIRLNN
jgi:glycosyltransferase involved in cell wall biosynthesis